MKRKLMLSLLLILTWAWSNQILLAQTLVYDDSDAPFSILTPTLTVLFPTAARIGMSGPSITLPGIRPEHSLKSILTTRLITAAAGSRLWLILPTMARMPGRCRPRYHPTAWYGSVMVVDGNPSDASNTIFSISSSDTETVSIPNQPTGSSLGLKNIDYSFSTGGSTSNLDHAVQYKFDWDDGSDSGWLAAGTTNASHSWAANGTYHIRALARCSIDTDIESLWSSALDLTISDHIGYYNSPSNRLILTEVNWSDNWTSEVQITDISGGSSVQAYYNCGTQRCGPFTLWMNSGGANRSVTFANILQTLDGLDAGAFTYMGTSGALELITQDGSHLIQGAVRTFNGSNSRTFPALADVETNTAASGRQLIVPNISNDISYRCSVVLFNPGTETVEAEVRIIGEQWIAGRPDDNENVGCIPDGRYHE